MNKSNTKLPGAKEMFGMNIKINPELGLLSKTNAPSKKLEKINEIVAKLNIDELNKML